MRPQQILGAANLYLRFERVPLKPVDMSSCSLTILKMSSFIEVDDYITLQVGVVPKDGSQTPQ